MTYFLPVEADPGDVASKVVKDCPASIIPLSSTAHTSTNPSPSAVLYVPSSRVIFIRAAIMTHHTYKHVKKVHKLTKAFSTREIVRIFNKTTQTSWTANIQGRGEALSGVRAATIVWESALVCSNTMLGHSFSMCRTLHLYKSKFVS